MNQTMASCETSDKCHAELEDYFPINSLCFLSLSFEDHLLIRMATHLFQKLSIENAFSMPTLFQRFDNFHLGVD